MGHNAGNKLKWTKEIVEEKIVSLLDQNWTVNEVARNLGMSRQRVYKLLSDHGFKEYTTRH